MSWFWKVRIHNKAGHYWHTQIKTGRELREIDAIQDFYLALTGAKMTLEGMSDRRFSDIAEIGDAFAGLQMDAS